MDDRRPMNVAILGAGHVGLVTGACLADAGNRVWCVDVNAAKIDQLKRGEVPFYEPGLQQLVRSNLRQRRLSFDTDAKEALRQSRTAIVAVDTPAREDGTADISRVLAAAATIGEHIDERTVVVNRSTATVGTAEQMRKTIAAALAARGRNTPFAVVANPEFVRAGTAIADFRNPDRVVVGTEDARAADVLANLYAPFVHHRQTIEVMDARSAELTKYAANAMLATRISLMNELANLAERVGADIVRVQRAIGADPRIGSQGIDAGCGYGGPCLPKDVRALVRMAADVGYDMPLVREVEAVNQRQRSLLAEKLFDYFDGSLAGRTIAVWGLAFKPATDDLGAAPGCATIDAILDADGCARAYDPAAKGTARQRYGNKVGVVLCDCREDALAGADALVVATEWAEFREPDFTAIKKVLKNPAIFDGRNLYDPHQLADLGFDHIAIGRGNVAARHDDG